jgi:hypothetical protein
VTPTSIQLFLTIDQKIPVYQRDRQQITSLWRVVSVVGAEYPWLQATGGIYKKIVQILFLWHVSHPDSATHISWEARFSGFHEESVTVDYNRRLLNRCGHGCR